MHLDTLQSNYRKQNKENNLVRRKNDLLSTRYSSIRLTANKKIVNFNNTINHLVIKDIEDGRGIGSEQKKWKGLSKNCQL